MHRRMLCCRSAQGCSCDLSIVFPAKQSNKTKLDTVHKQTAYANSSQMELMMAKIVTEGLGVTCMQLLELDPDCCPEDADPNFQAWS